MMTIEAALRLAIRQNSHDMLMTGEEIRQCESVLSDHAQAQPSKIKLYADQALRADELADDASQNPEVLEALAREVVWWRDDGNRGAWAARPTWQPIETAPKDATSMLVYHNRMILEAWYSPLWGKFVVAETGGTNSIKPTHWMPLPPPPAD